MFRLRGWRKSVALPCEQGLHKLSYALNPGRVINGEVRSHVTRVQSSRWLKQQNVDFSCSNWTMFGSTRNDHELAFLQVQVSSSPAIVLILHPERSMQDEKQLILIIVPMPNELALELHQFDVLPVQLAYDPRRPVLAYRLELLAQSDLLHASIVST